MVFILTLFVAGAHAAALYTNSTGPTSTSHTSTVTSGQTGPTPWSDPYFRNPFDILVLDSIPVANGTDPKDLSNPAVSQMESDYAYCSTLWDSAVSVWAKTAYYSPGNITKRAIATPSSVILTTAPPKSVSSNITATQIVGEDELADPKTYTQTLSGEQRVFTWTASEPCCRACSIYGGSVQVFYWPTATQNPPVSTLIDSKGFVFTSPSVYVAFQSVQASNFCGNIGLRNNAPTLAFKPGELSTSEGFFYDAAKYTATPITPYPAQYTEANWGDAKTCGWTTTTFWQLNGDQTKYSDFAAASSAAVSYSAEYSTQILPTYASHLRVSELVEQYTVSHDPCFPSVTIPSSSFTLTNKENGQLTYCGGAFGFYDPPFALSRGTGFSTEATTTSAAANVNGKLTLATSSVQPGVSPVPTTAALTSSLPTATESVTASSSSTAIISAANDLATPSATVNTPAAENSPITSSTSTLVVAESSPITSSTTTPVAINDPPTTSGTTTPVAISNSPATSVASNLALTSNAPAPTTSPDPILLTPVTQAATTTNAPAQIPISSSTIVADPSSSAFVVASQTLTAGGQVTYSDSVYSLATNGGSLIVAGSSTQILADPATPATTPAKITVGSSTITANPSSAFVIASQTLIPGGQITHADTVYSLASNGASLVVAASTTQNLAVSSPAPAAPSAYIIGSQTLVPGAAVTVSGTVVSIQAGGSSVVVAGTTAPLSQYLALPTSVIVGSQTQALNAFLADVSAPASLVSGDTTQAISLVPGPSSGAPLSVVVGGSKTVALTQFLASATGDASVVVGESKTLALSSYLAVVTGGATVVVGSKTETLTSLLAQATGSSGVAGIIASLGGFTTPSPKATSPVQVGSNGTYNGTVYMGNAAALEGGIMGAACMAIVGIVGALML